MAGLLAPVIWVYFECSTLVSKFDMWVISCLQPSPRSSAWVIPCERLVLGQAIEPWHFSVSLMNNNDLCANESWVTYQYANCWRVTVNFLLESYEHCIQIASDLFWQWNRYLCSRRCIVSVQLDQEMTSSENQSDGQDTVTLRRLRLVLKQQHKLDINMTRGQS